jgi:transcriptional regulator with XRE-family HTH domain
MTTIRPDLAPRPQDFRPRLAERLREVRSALDLTQRDVAARSGLRPDRLSRYENGLNPPTALALFQMAAAFGVPTGLLFPESPLPSPTDTEFDRLCRKIWLYPPAVRDVCAQVLRGLSDFYELIAARTLQHRSEGGRHAPRP